MERKKRGERWRECEERERERERWGSEWVRKRGRRKEIEKEKGE